MRILVLLSLLSSMVVAAPISPMDGYQTTNHSESELEVFWKKVSAIEKDLKGKDCFKRATIWSYKLYKEDRVFSKKVFMHYTNKFNNELDNLGRRGLSNRLGRVFSRNIAWDFHVAPAVTINGEDYVLDPYLRNKPEKTIEWVEYLTQRGEYRLKKRKKDLLKDLKKARKKLRRALRSENSTQTRIADLKKEVKKIKDKMDYLGLTESPNQVIDIKCRKIDHIMEFDRNQKTEWCFYQETSMYYYATRELRFLNYGVLNIDMRHPIQNLDFHTEENYNRGRNYVMRQWNTEDLERSLDEYRFDARPETYFEI